jgi:hypothetical protein
MVVRWQQQASCAGLAPAFDCDQIEVPHIICCAGCPVRLDCLAYGLKLTREQDFGVWGGLDRIQRGRIRGNRTTASAEWGKNLAHVDAALA